MGRAFPPAGRHILNTLSQLTGLTHPHLLCGEILWTRQPLACSEPAEVHANWIMFCEKKKKRQVSLTFLMSLSVTASNVDGYRPHLKGTPLN